MTDLVKCGRCKTARSKLAGVFTFLSGSSADLPTNARPDAEVAAFTPTPTEWVTVLGESLEGFSWGIGSYLTPPSARERALAKAAGEHGAGGSAGIYTAYPHKDIEFDEGLTDSLDAEAEFFVHRRDHHGLAEPSVEFRQSFLWYFDAIPRNDGSWFYLDDAGHDHELVRVTHRDNELRVDVAALPLRRYLAARKRVLVLQLDRRTRLDAVPEPKIYAVDRTELRHFALHSGDIPGATDKPGFVRLVGKQIVLPVDAAREDLARRHPSQKRYPHFTIGVDPDTGEPVTASCDPDRVSDYYTDRGGPHYLTRVYFKPAVLGRYTAQPSRYQITGSQLSCLSLWAIPIGTNPEGLIEAYLGDLGRRLPAEERDYWVSFNTPPAGGCDEARYRRDILGAWVDGPPHPLRELFAARARFSDAMAALLGGPVYNAWDPRDQIAFDGLHLPTTNEQSEADNLILRLAKGVIDYLDVKALRQLSGVRDASAPSITCLQGWVTDCGADSEALISPLRLLQGLRSSGAAHARGSNWDKTLAHGGLKDIGPDQLFLRVLALITDALNGLADLAERKRPYDPNAT